MAKYIIIEKIVNYYEIEIEAETKESADDKYLNGEYKDEDRYYCDSEIIGYEIEEV